MATRNHVPNIGRWANDDCPACSEHSSGGRCGIIVWRSYSLTFGHVFVCVWGVEHWEVFQWHIIAGHPKYIARSCALATW